MTNVKKRHESKRKQGGNERRPQGGTVKEQINSIQRQLVRAETKSSDRMKNQPVVSPSQGLFRTVCEDDEGMKGKSSFELKRIMWAWPQVHESLTRAGEGVCECV